jgi:ribosomal protein S18 acetylase RimI-like enzyme
MLTLIHQWLQQRFNIAPKRGATPLIDLQGEKHWLVFFENEHSARFHIVRFGTLVADADLWWEEDHVLFIRMIVIHQAEYRRRSIGTTLLLQVIAYAKRKHARGIWSDVARNHSEKNPHLLDWYREYGFQVTPIQSGLFIARIYLDLTSTQ